jgi:hypothetical protein
MGQRGEWRRGIVRSANYLTVAIVSFVVMFRGI